MALTILNNIAAIAAENQLNITSNSLNSTLEQLSSGSRINSGADDPAGLAIANGLSANIAALTQSSANATGGIGELQVADGALSQVTTLLNRAVTLATESATGTVSNPQRIALDNEYQSIKTEINSIGSTTNYNGGQVFTTNTLNVFLGDGSATGSSQIGVTTGALSANGLNLGGAVAATATLAQGAGTPAAPATDLLTGANPTEAIAASGTLIATLTDTIANTDTATINGTVYSFVNTATDLTGAANQVVIGGSNNQALINLTAAINNTNGGAGVEFGGVTAANSSVTAAYTSPAGVGLVTLTANTNGSGGNAVTLATSADLTKSGGFLTLGSNGTTVAVGGKTYTFVQSLSSLTSAQTNEVIAGGAAGAVTGVEATALSNLVLAVNQGTGSGTNYGAGTTQNTQVSAGPSSGTTVLFTANNAGTTGNTISGVVTGAGGSFATLDFTNGANAGTAPSVVAGDSVTVGSQTYNFVAALTTPTANQTQVLVGANEVASLTNLVNAVNGGSGLGESYAYGSTVGADATAGVNASASAAFSTNATTGLDQVVFTALAKGTVGNTIATSQAGSGNNTFSGALMTGGAAGSVNDLLTQSDAQSALSLIDGAVAQVAALRGNIGATVNRLQSASNVINNQTQNLTAAENNVTAADIPTAVANLTQYSILEQTGISALAQANQQQQLVLKLLT
jgi:flagellin